MTVGLQLLDNFLLKYNVGQAILLMFLLSLPVGLLLKSLRVLSLIVVTFGLVFVMTPTQLAPLHFKFLGVALLVVGPVLFVMGRR